LRFVRALGESPLSRVLLVEDAQGKRFALKILRASVARDPRLRARWQREAKLLQELRHPQLVKGYGTAEVDGCPALLLEFIDGPTLRARLQEHPLEWEQACRYGVQIARALDRLHRAGAIHRDVKPHNILLHPQRGAVLADLGLVRREEDTTLTRHGAALGSPAYMSPEQARDPSTVDAQADLYSLGATLHHALGGVPPFQGRGVGEVIHRVLHEAPEALPQTVPPPLAKVIATAMAKDTEKRYARARDLGHDLGRVLLGHPPRLLTRNRRRRRQHLLLGLAAVPALLLLAFWVRPWSWIHGSPQQNLAADGGVDAPPPDASSAAGRAKQRPELPPPPPDPVSAFLHWSRGHRQDFSAALQDQELRRALGILGQLEGAEVPAAAPPGFLQERRRYLAAQRLQVDAVAERVGGQALDLLDERLSLARAAMARGPFQVDMWRQEVLRAWDGAALPVAELPLRPGGVDPAGRLRLAAASLEAEDEAAGLERALARVPQLLAADYQLLREGRFAEARQRWEGLEPKAFLQSLEARAEVVRIDELLALDRRLVARLREHVGQELELTLASGSILSGTLLPEEEGYVLDYFGQARIPVRLLDLDAATAVSWLSGEADDWLVAQLLWCQGDLAQALTSMRAVQASATPEEWQPRLWLWLWQQEMDRSGENVADPSAPAPSSEGEGAVPTRVDGAGPVEAVAAGDPREGLERAILRQYPKATFTRLSDGSLEAAFQDVLIDQRWELDLRGEGRPGDLLRWSLQWQLPAEETAPGRVSWLEDIVLKHPGGRLLPSLRVAGRDSEGFGIEAGGGVQLLSWDGREVQLDGLMVAPWQAPSSPRGRFLLTSSEPFKIQSLRLRLRPH